MQKFFGEKCDIFSTKGMEKGKKEGKRKKGGKKGIYIQLLVLANAGK